MRTASAKALEAGREALDERLAGKHTAKRVSENFFALAGLLKHNGSLRRSLTDPARSAADKGDLVEDLFASRIDSVSLATLVTLVGLRWSSEKDLGKVLRSLGIRALIIDSAENGHLDLLQDELSAVRNLLRDNRDLRVALSPASRYTQNQRSDLVEKVFAHRIADVTMRFLVRLVTHPQHASLIAALDAIAVDVAEYRDRRLVRVTSAQALSDEQVQRLHRLLKKKYGPVTINVAVNPRFLGGLRVRVGSDAIDGTLKANIAGVKQRLGV